MRNICKYTSIALLLAGAGASAQSLEEMSDGSQAESDSVYAVVHALKLDPVQVFFGDYRLYYEHMLGLGSSIEIGAGPTGRNYAASWFEDDLDTNGSNININTGYALSLALRKYIAESGELYGSYFSLSLSFHRYEKTYSVQNDAGVTLPGYEYEDNRSYTTLIMQYGYQALPLKSNIFADLYVGLGLRYKDLDVVDTTDLHNPSMYSVSSVYGFVPAAIAGAKIGFGW